MRGGSRANKWFGLARLSILVAAWRLRVEKRKDRGCSTVDELTVTERLASYVRHC